MTDPTRKTDTSPKPSAGTDMPAGDQHRVPRSGETASAARNDQAASPKLPHERDESINHPKAPPDEVIEQGRKDAERGLKDTSKAEATDSAYQKLKS